MDNALTEKECVMEFLIVPTVLMREIAVSKQTADFQKCKQTADCTLNKQEKDPIVNLMNFNVTTRDVYLKLGVVTPTMIAQMVQMKLIVQPILQDHHVGSMNGCAPQAE